MEKWLTKQLQTITDRSIRDQACLAERRAVYIEETHTLLYPPDRRTSDRVSGFSVLHQEEAESSLCSLSNYGRTFRQAIDQASSRSCPVS